MSLLLGSIVPLQTSLSLVLSIDEDDPLDTNRALSLPSLVLAYILIPFSSSVLIPFSSSLVTRGRRFFGHFIRLQASASRCAIYFYFVVSTFGACDKALVCRVSSR